MIGGALNRELLDYFTGDPNSKKGGVILLATLDANGWPHFAMLSHWEIAAQDKNTLRLASYRGSKTTANMKRNGKVTVVVVERGMSYYIKGTARVAKEKMKRDEWNTMLKVRVDKVLKDSLAGAEIVHGIEYRKEESVEPHEMLYEELTER